MRSRDVRDHGLRTARSDRELEFVECGRQPEHWRRFDSEFVVAAAQVLDDGMATDDDARGPVGLQAPHRSESGFQSTVVGLTPVVLALSGVLERRRNELVDDVSWRRSPIGGHLRRVTVRSQ